MTSERAPGFSPGEEEDVSVRLARAKEAAEEALRRRWSEDPPPVEPTYRYVVEFDCCPSVFERIKAAVSTEHTYRRTFRFYAAKAGGEVMREWQSRT